MSLKYRIYNLIKDKWLNRFVYGNEIPKEHKHKIRFIHGAYGSIIGKGIKIGNNLRLGSHVIIGHGKNKGLPTIKDNVTIYSHCMIIGNITIGENTIIGMGTFINKDIPANSLVYNKKELIIKEKYPYCSHVIHEHCLECCNKYHNYED